MKSFALLALLTGAWLQDSNQNNGGQGGQNDVASQSAKDDKKAVKKGITVLVNGELVKFGANGPRSFNGRTMVPFRPLFEKLGAAVEYDLVHKSITADKDDIKIELTIGEKIGKRNGAEITMDVAPILLKGTTYVPLRFVAEALEAEVNFDGATQEITIKTKDATPPMDDDGDGDKTDKKVGDGRI